LPITDIAAKLGLTEPRPCTNTASDKAKVNWPANPSAVKKNGHLGKLILVTSISPTPAGEGKSTMTIGFGDAINNQLQARRR
jgi:formate--tetrahydrofolate ligase